MYISGLKLQLYELHSIPFYDHSEQWALNESAYTRKGLTTSLRVISLSFWRLDGRFLFVVWVLHYKSVTVNPKIFNSIHIPRTFPPNKSQKGLWWHWKAIRKSKCIRSFWAGLASFGQLDFFSDPSINFTDTGMGIMITKYQTMYL